MSLNWSVLKIEDYEELMLKGTDKDGEYEHVNPVTDGIVWMTLIVDIGRITDENWKEFYLRVKMYEALKGRYFYDHEVTPELIQRHIGLVTNVSTSKVNWNKKVRLWMREKISTTGDKWSYEKTKSKQS